MIDFKHFEWQEREGRFHNGEPFHEWVYVHGSGRIIASVQAPTDQRGGFTHEVSFLFSQDVMMRGGPFLFLDFDSGKRFVESRMSVKVQDVNMDGTLTAEPPQPSPDMAAIVDGMKAAMASVVRRPTVDVP